MSTQTAQIQSLQAVGLTTSILLSGIYFASTHLSIPLIYNLPPRLSTPAFAQLYKAGTQAIVPLAVSSAVASATLAYLLPERRNTYLIASAATLSSQPWTVFVMMGTIKQLLAISENAAQREKVSLSEVQALLGSWSRMNMVRSVASLAGGLAGVYALL